MAECVECVAAQQHTLSGLCPAAAAGSPKQCVYAAMCCCEQLPQLIVQGRVLVQQCIRQKPRTAQRRACEQQTTGAVRLCCVNTCTHLWVGACAKAAVVVWWRCGCMCLRHTHNTHLLCHHHHHQCGARVFIVCLWRLPNLIAACWVASSQLKIGG